MKKLLWFIFALAFFLRIYQVGQPVLKEDEFSTVKAATYVYHCQIDSSRCRYQLTNFRSRFLVLITANETIPNLAAEVYLWDFIKDQAGETHFARAWPHLCLVAGGYRLLGINELTSRLISVVAGSLLVLVGYLFSRVMKSSVNLSLLYSFLLAISFSLIDFSRNARMYPLYGLVFLVLTSAIFRSKWLLASGLFIVAYWLQMLTLILPIAILIWAVIERRREITLLLLFGLVTIFGLTKFYGVDFFGTQFLTISWPPHWQYLNWWWLGAIIILVIKRFWYLLLIILTYLVVLVFFTYPAPGSAYLIMLWPLALWTWLNWHRLTTVIIVILLLLQFFMGINYLYFGRDDRAGIKQAYQTLIDQYQTGDKIYAIQLRDFYLQGLPENTPVIDLQMDPNPVFSGSGFIVWEQEKARHFKQETLNFIRTNFKSIGSQGVEIYSFGK